MKHGSCIILLRIEIGVYRAAVYSTREKDKTTSDVTDAMLLVKNKSIALLWDLNSIFM